MKKGMAGFESWWKVYGLGELCKMEGAILPNWTFGEFNNKIPYGFGGDFGFNESDVLVKVGIDRKNKIIYCDQKIYNDSNSSEQLRMLIALFTARNDLIVTDCADSSMITKLKSYFNIHPVNKKKWTVAEALTVMQDYEIIITCTSCDLAKELNNYIWYDKKAGIPIGERTHAIDAVRHIFQYLYYSLGLSHDAANPGPFGHLIPE